jgi:hypothetical protein
LNCITAEVDILTFPKSGITSPAVAIKSLHKEAGGSFGTLFMPA